MQHGPGPAQARSEHDWVELAFAPLQAAEMPATKSNDPLHGVTLARIVTELSEHFGWAEMGERVPVRCFLFDPSVKSSLTFLRKTPWARARVEEMYVQWKAPP
jgi:uncharacterized protein (DUF2132 family)